MQDRVARRARARHRARPRIVRLAEEQGELDSTRTTLVERADVPVLLVRAGLHPGGLAPERTLTRFSWSLSDP